MNPEPKSSVNRLATPLVIYLLSAFFIGGLKAATAGGLITIETGNLPIILSAPHGGGEAIPNVPVRKGVGIRFFRAQADMRTDRLAENLADALERKFGARPYVVIARFHRKYLDANRPADLAYESEHAKATYDAYHRALATARADVTRRWGSGLLLDLHGQAAESDAIFRGTQNGKTTTHLVKKFGRDALAGRTSLFGQLAKQGIRVIPAAGSDDRETKYQGGYIVVTYGSAAGGSIDAIQLELGKELRSGKANTVEQVANAIGAYAKDFLPEAKQERTGDGGEEQVRVGVYRDVGAGKSVKDLLRTLEQFEGVEVRNLMADDIRSGALSDLDVLIQPGGSGGGQGRHLGEAGRAKIREFLRAGGGYIGICAGAYLASADYDWSLDVLDAKVLDRKHWARGKGMVDIELSEIGQSLLRSEKETLRIFYAQGPLLAPAGKADIADYETVATFKTEIAKNGAPQGVMKGTTAIARGKFGRGRVICFSPHPEMTHGLEALVHYAIEHVSKSGQQ